MKILKYSRIIRGGDGSGHFGHAGRPGKVGGSAPRDKKIGNDPKMDFARLKNLTDEELIERAGNRFVEGTKDNLFANLQPFSFMGQQPFTGIDAWLTPDGIAYNVSILGHVDSAMFALELEEFDLENATTVDTDGSLSLRSLMLNLGFTRITTIVSTNNNREINIQSIYPLNRPRRDFVKDMLATFPNANLVWESETFSSTSKKEFLQIIERTKNEQIFLTKFVRRFMTN